STASSTRSGVRPRNVLPGSAATPGIVSAGRRQRRAKRSKNLHRRGDQPRGLTHVSDQARHALDDCRSPRISAHTWPFGVLPFSSTRAVFAGKNVLKTPIGRFMKPGGALSTNGAIVSVHVMTMRSLPATIVSVAGLGGAP